jgi:phage terminase small subunit
MTKAKWIRNPDGLSELALKHWKRYAPGLHAEGHLDNSESVESFRQLCRLLAIAETAEAEIVRDGVTIAAALDSIEVVAIVATNRAW